LIELECVSCGYRWVPRKSKHLALIICPKCSSYDIYLRVRRRVK
jgi:predicted RNA-binding Zn-ribbon protein involved in translation (DUF1610 family)